MKSNKALTCLVSFFAFAFASGSVQTLAATPSFTIIASSTTMPSTSRGSIAFTLTAVDGYTGGVEVGCTPPTHSAGTNIPTCNAPEPYGGGAPLYVQLTPNTPVVNQSVYLYALPASIADNQDAQSNRLGSGGAVDWALAGVLMLGFGFRQRRGRWLAHLLLPIAMLIGLAGMVSCAGAMPSAPTLTPGTYTYTVWAIGTTPDFSASTTVTVTVPSGIVVL